MATLKIDHREGYPRCLWTSVFGSLLGSFQFGYQVGVLNTALSFVAKDVHYHKDAVLSSAVVLGAALGALTAGKLADTLGPRHAQVLNCGPFLLGCITAAVGANKHLFLAGRFVSGIGAGAASLYVPRYLAEISPAALRGRLGSLNQVMINTGILAALCAGIPYEAGFKGFDAFGGNVWVSWWRVMIILGLVPAVLQILVLTTCPESPVWLEHAGRRDASDDACIRLWGPHALLPDPDYEADAARAADLVTSASQHLRTQTSLATAGSLGQTLSTPLLQHAGSTASLMRVRSISQQPQQSGGSYSMGQSYSPRLGFSTRTTSSTQNRSGAAAADVEPNSQGLEGWDSLFARRYRLMMALAVGLPLLQQASGINTVVYYSSKVFAAAGLKSAITASIITGVVNLAFTVASAAVLDRFGRKPLLLLSYLGMAVALGAVSGVAVMSLPDSLAGLLMVVLILLYVAFFATGSGPISWVVLSEVLPPRIKGPAASVATAAAWMGNLMVTLSFDTLLKHMGLGGTYLLYALLNGGAAAYVAALLVETRCRTLQEIEDLLLLPDVDPRLAALYPALRRSCSGESSAAAGVSAGGSPPPLGPRHHINGSLPTAASNTASFAASNVPVSSTSGFYSHQLTYRSPAAVVQQQQQSGLLPYAPVLGHDLAANFRYIQPAAASSVDSGMTPAALADLATGPESLMQLPSAAAVAAALAPVAHASNPSQHSGVLSNLRESITNMPESELPSALPDVSQPGVGSDIDDFRLSRHEFVTEWAHGASVEAAAAATSAPLSEAEDQLQDDAYTTRLHSPDDVFQESDVPVAQPLFGRVMSSDSPAAPQQQQRLLRLRASPVEPSRKASMVQDVNGIVTITGFVVPGAQNGSEHSPSHG